MIEAIVGFIIGILVLLAGGKVKRWMDKGPKPEPVPTIDKIELDRIEEKINNQEILDNKNEPSIDEIKNELRR